jgi:hypothetical protein
VGGNTGMQKKSRAAIENEKWSMETSKGIPVYRPPRINFFGLRTFKYQGSIVRIKKILFWESGAKKKRSSIFPFLSCSSFFYIIVD